MSEHTEQGTDSQETDPAIYAVAPRLHQEEGPVDVSASPAFQCLDEVRHHSVRLLISRSLLESFSSQTLEFADHRNDKTNCGLPVPLCLHVSCVNYKLPFTYGICTYY